MRKSSPSVRFPQPRATPNPQDHPTTVARSSLPRTTPRASTPTRYVPEILYGPSPPNSWAKAPRPPLFTITPSISTAPTARHWGGTPMCCTRDKYSRFPSSRFKRPTADQIFSPHHFLKGNPSWASRIFYPRSPAALQHSARFLPRTLTPQRPALSRALAKAPTGTRHPWPLYRPEALTPRIDCSSPALRADHLRPGTSPSNWPPSASCRRYLPPN